MMQIYQGAWGGAWEFGSWVGSWGDSWGPDAVEEEPSRYRSPVISVSGGNQSSKVHLAELYTKKQLIEDNEKKVKLIKQDNDLISLITFMISSKLIT